MWQGINVLLLEVDLILLASWKHLGPRFGRSYRDQCDGQDAPPNVGKERVALAVPGGVSASANRRSG